MPSAAAGTPGTSALPTAIPSVSPPVPTPTIDPAIAEGIPEGPLAAGDYRAHLTPGFRFTIGSGWERRQPEPRLRDRYLMLFYAGGDGGEQIFIDVAGSGTPEDAIAPLANARLPGLTDPEATTIGGLPGIVVFAGPRQSRRWSVASSVSTC